MSAKKNGPSSPSKPGSTAAAVATPGPGSPAPAPAGDVAATPWIESSNPRRRLVGQIALIAIWVYVAALWLLALDQWFNWGIFGPKIPPVP